MVERRRRYNSSRAEARLLSRAHLGRAPQLLVVFAAVAVCGVVVLHLARAAGVVGDLNGDGTVNVFDLSILLSDWGKSGTAADLNGDGSVNIFDLSVLLSHWGQTPSPSPTGVAGTSYYVDCAGSDANNGTSQSSAWATLSKANAATLAPGDGLFFKRGCSWTGSLTVKWSSVTVGNYGSGNLPVLTTSVDHTNIVNIVGSGDTIDGLQVNAGAPSTDPNCGNNPVGHIVDFNFPSGSANNIVRNSTATGAYAGFYLNFGAHDNHVLHNVMQDNIMMWPLDTSANNDAGAFGVLLWGNNNEIAWNTINGSNACSYDYGRDGSAVEVFNGSANNVHHNKALADETFTELGKDSSHTSDGNIFAYNQYVASTTGIFLNTRGSGNSYGPITNTVAYNNVAYITSTNSAGAVVCSGCGSNILTLKNNILWDNVKALYTDAAFPESNNLYWAASGSPLIQGLTIAGTSKKANPLWVAAGTDFHLTSGSPAVNAGTSDSVNAGYSVDLDNIAVPAGSAVDMGAYEFH